MKWPTRLRNITSSHRTQKKQRVARRVVLYLEELESRALLSASSATASPPTPEPATDAVIQPMQVVAPQTVSPSKPVSVVPQTIHGYTPQQIQTAYNVGPLLTAGITGKGETIAIVDAYYDPNIVNDVNNFDIQFALPGLNQLGGPYLKVVNSVGTPVSGMAQDPSWGMETSMDVEWAHAMAPQANILLVEVPNDSLDSLLSGVHYASNYPGVAVVSMSWGQNEFSGETAYDSYFLPKSASNPNGGNPGVTFVAASGDSGAADGPIYPATSPYVLAVGGTSLSLTGINTYASETAWSSSGGGPSAYEGEPSYQSNQASIGSTNVELHNPLTGAVSFANARITPDVSFNADPTRGYAVYDSMGSTAGNSNGGWVEVGGTSAGAPQWSALVALADQQRAAQGGTSLDTNQVQTTLYNTLGTSTYGKVFHDVSTGSNGYTAHSGYDWATGLGSPIANNLVPLLAGTKVAQGQLPAIKGSGVGPGVTPGSRHGSFSMGSLVSTSSGGQAGGGLFSSSGSLSILPPSLGVSGSNGQIVFGPLIPFALPATTSFAPITTGTASSTLTSANTFVGNIAMLAPSSSSAAIGSSTPAVSPGALTAQDNISLGASGWNGAPLSWRLGNHGLFGSSGELSPDGVYVNDRESGDAAADNSSDANGSDWFFLDLTAPPILEGDAADGGDGGDGGE